MKKYILFASFFGFIAVGLGALGSHGFKDILLENNHLETFNIAVDYLFYHAIMLLVTAFFVHKFPEKNFGLSGWAFIAGNIFFSLNMVIISLLNFKMFTFLNPIGGTLLMAGWINLGIQSFKIKK